MNSFLEELREEGFKYVEMSKDEYPIWSLWDSSETILINGMVYRDLLEDSIYFEGNCYNAELDKETDTITVYAYKDSVLEVFIHEDGDSPKKTLEMAKELQEKINNGYTPKVRDVLGKFVGAETPYEFVEEGTHIRTFECDDIVEYLEETLNI